jgi:2-methylfumaryl-CoA hydratase
MASSGPIQPRYGRLLADFDPGATYEHPWDVTVSSGMVALYQSAFLDATPLYSSRRYAQALGFAREPLHPLLCLNLALSFSVHDVSEQAIAHLAYLDVRFPDAGYTGDTVTARSTVLDVTPSASGDKGVVHVRTALLNQDERLLCVFERKALIRGGHLDARPPDPQRRVEAVPALPSVHPMPAQLRDYKSAALRTGFPALFDDFAVGQTFAHALGRTIGESEHMQLTTLMRNSHPLHFDALYSKESSFTKARVVYGGLVFAWTCALASRDLAGNALWELGYSAGAHPAAVAAGDTLYAASRVVQTERLSPAAGAVTFALVAVKNMTSRAALQTHGDALFAEELPKGRPQKISDKVFEIRRTLLVRARSA